MTAVSKRQRVYIDLEGVQNPRGVGDVITNQTSAQLISGVEIHPVSLYPDDRGYFLEVARMGVGPVCDFPAKTTQVSATLSYPGAIKGFHYHLQQAELWCPVAGVLQTALIDLRPDSPSYGRRNTIYIGSLRPWQLRIPPGVGHGYKVIGSDPAVLVCMTDRFYNSDDEGRIPYNHVGIHYDWDTQHK